MGGSERRWAVLRFGGVAALLGVGGISLLLYRPPADLPAPRPRDAGTASTAPTESDLGVHALTELSPSAAYLVETTDGLALVDTGVHADCSALLSAVRRRGFDIRDLRIILLTHCHGDHVNGAQHLRQLTAAKIHAGLGDCDVLRAGTDRIAIFSKYENPDVSVHPTEVDVELRGGESIVLGDVAFDVLAAPGHTPGSVCYYMRRGLGPRIMFSGDVILARDTLGTYTTRLAPDHRGDAAAYLDTLRRLYELPPPEILMPGHPGIFADVSLDPVDEGEWRSLLGEGIAAMLDLLERYRADGHDFLDGRLREFLPGLLYLGDIDGAALYCVRGADGWSLIDAPGGESLIDVLAERLSRQGLALGDVRQVFLTSCDPQAISGLTGLVERTGCRVVAGAAGLESLRGLCPPETVFLAAEALSAGAGQAVRATPLAGLGLAPTAYVWELAGKRVLAAGRLPIDLNDAGEFRFFEDPTVPGRDLAAYADSMEKLSRLQPDVWLSPRPIAQRNANVYPEDWAQIIDRNLRLARVFLDTEQRRAGR